MGKTKKVKTTGRLGPRYGVGIRKRILKIEEKQQKKYQCPFCGFKKVQRKAPGIYACRKCKAKFTGGAYTPETLPGTIIKKTVAQKSFKEKELTKALEEQEKEETKKENKEKREEKPKQKQEKENKEKKQEKPKKEKETKKKEPTTKKR